MSAIIYRDTVKVNGKTLVKGTQLTVEGIRGRVIFSRYAVNVDTMTDWLDVIVLRTRRARSIKRAAVKTVHRNKLVG